ADAERATQPVASVAGIADVGPNHLPPGVQPRRPAGARRPGKPRRRGVAPVGEAATAKARVVPSPLLAGGRRPRTARVGRAAVSPERADRVTLTADPS